MEDDRLEKDLMKEDYPELADQDILEAMKTIPGYLDITPADFKEIYLHAFQLAIERLSRSVIARHIMTKAVVWVRPETSVMKVAEEMALKGVSGVPVLDDENRVLGIISEKDILNRLGDGAPQNVMGVIARCLQAQKCLAQPLRGQTARDIMSSPIISLRPEATLGEISSLFHARHINRAPVLDPQDRLLGIVSRGDIIKADRRGLK
jgi:CBS domain-containing membrane protein